MEAGIPTYNSPFCTETYNPGETYYYTDFSGDIQSYWYYYYGDLICSKFYHAINGTAAVIALIQFVLGIVFLYKLGKVKEALPFPYINHCCSC